MAGPSPVPRSIRGVLGAEASEDLMTWVDSSHSELLAGIRADAAERQQEMYAHMQAMERRIMDQMRAMEERMDTRILAVDEKLSNRIAGLEEKLSDRMRALDEKLGGQIHAVDARVADSKAELMRWSLVFWVSAVAAIAALAGILRAG